MVTSDRVSAARPGPSLHAIGKLPPRVDDDARRIRGVFTSIGVLAMD